MLPGFQFCYLDPTGIWRVSCCLCLLFLCKSRAKQPKWPRFPSQRPRDFRSTNGRSLTSNMMSKNLPKSKNADSMLANPNTLLNLHVYIQLVAHQDSNLCMYVYIYNIYIYIILYIYYTKIQNIHWSVCLCVIFIYGKSTHQMAPLTSQGWTDQRSPSTCFEFLMPTLAGRSLPFQGRVEMHRTISANQDCKWGRSDCNIRFTRCQLPHKAEKIAP